MLITYLNIDAVSIQSLSPFLLCPLQPNYRLSDNEFVCQSRRLGFDPWVRKIPWRRKWPPTPVFLPGESPWTEEPRGLHSPWGSKESDTTEGLSTAQQSTAQEKWVLVWFITNWLIEPRTNHVMSSKFHPPYLGEDLTVLFPSPFSLIRISVSVC